MNDQSETAQLRFLEETAIRLRQNGFTVSEETVGELYGNHQAIIRLRRIGCKKSLPRFFLM